MVVERRGFFAQGRVAQEGYLADVRGLSGKAAWIRGGLPLVSRILGAVMFLGVEK